MVELLSQLLSPEPQPIILLVEDFSGWEGYTRSGTQSHSPKHTHMSKPETSSRWLVTGRFLLIAQGALLSSLRQH